MKKLVSVVLITVMTALFIAGCSTGYEKMNDASDTGSAEGIYTSDALICICASVAVLGLYYWLSRFLPERVKDFFKKMSGNINRIYIAQWLIICYSWGLYVIVFGDSVPSNGIIVLWAIGVLLLSLIAVRFIPRFIKKKPSETAAPIEMK